MASLKDRCVAAMVLAGVGDALGYYNGKWEFCYSGRKIQDELKEKGGLEKIKVSKPRWIVSDDTVMHLATAEAMVKCGDKGNDKECLYGEIAKYYQKCMRDMKDRAPGMTCMASTHQLRPGREKGYRVPFNSRGGGCGAAMRAMCIGIRYNKEENLNDLIAVSIESGRMTHHHPTGYLGSLASALFTSYALQGKPVIEWGKGLKETLPKAKHYIQENTEGEDLKGNMKEWDYFKERWTKYLEERQITNGEGEPVFPKKYDAEERDVFYKDISYSGWGGSSGHDAPMIAYDALLGCKAKDWTELCNRSMFHGGDSDSTGTIAACCYGAMYGFDGVPDKNHKDLEYRDRLKKAGEKLYELSQILEKSSKNDVRTSKESDESDKDSHSKSVKGDKSSQSSLDENNVQKTSTTEEAAEETLNQNAEQVAVGTQNQNEVGTPE